MPQIIETLVTTTDKSSSQNYTHPDDQTTLRHVTPRVQNCDSSSIALFHLVDGRIIRFQTSGRYKYTNSLWDRGRVGVF